MKCLFSRLLYFLPIPVFFISINYFVDPANLFNNEIYEKIVGHLTNGENVTNVPNLDERLLQKLLIENLNECPEEIILGSSRIMLIGKTSDTQKEKYINNGVSGASIEDFFSILYLYEKKGCKIKKISLGIEPFLLNENNGQTRWKTLEFEFFELYNQLFTQKKRSNSLISSKYNELFSFSYFKSSLEFLFSKNNKHIHPTTNIYNVEMTRLSDGSITYDNETRNLSSSKVDRKVEHTILDQPLYSMRDFKQLSEYNKVLFTFFIDYIIRNNIETEFIFVPLHPLLFNYLQNDPNYKMFFEAEAFYREIALKKNINIVGSFDPNKYNLNSADFYDGFHCKEGIIKKLYSKSFSKIEDCIN